MEEKLFIVYVQKDILPAIRMCLSDFGKQIMVQYVGSLDLLNSVFEKENCHTLIIDSIVAGESSLDFVKDIRNRMPGLKILLVASSMTTKDQLIGIIRQRSVNGILLRPFTLNQMSDYIYRFSGLAKPYRAGFVSNWEIVK